MKKLLTLACAFVVFRAAAQRPSFGLKAGLSFPSFSAAYRPAYSGDGINYGYDVRWSYVVGVCADIPLRRSLFLRSGIELVGKKAKFKYADNRLYEYVEKIGTIEAPANLVYKTRTADKPHWVVGGGPAFGLILRESGSGVAQLTQPFLCLNALAGCEFPVGLNFNVNYSYGLTNVAGGGSREFTSLRLHYLGFSTSYFF